MTTVVFSNGKEIEDPCIVCRSFSQSSKTAGGWCLRRKVATSKYNTCDHFQAVTRKEGWYEQECKVIGKSTTR